MKRLVHKLPFISLFILIFSLIWGCPLSHVNPLDPESPNYIPPPALYTKDDFVANMHSLHTLRTFPAAEFYSVLAEAWPLRSIPLDTVMVSYKDWPAVGLRLSTDGLWTARFLGSYFNDPHLGSVIGQPFTLTFHGIDGGACVLDPVYVFRVIVDSPVLIDPVNNAHTGPFPTFQWETFTGEFPFEYLIEVLMIDSEHQFEVVIWRSDRIPATITQNALTDSLADGMYYWTLSVIDPFANESRSREGFFSVLADTQP